jgi:ABC-type multidrug transport system ATPase subunit
MFEAQQTASRIIIINKGRIVADDTVSHLQQTLFSALRLRIVCDRPSETKNILEKYGECILDGEALLLSTEKDANLNEILRDVIAVDRIREINTIQPTLEEIVMEKIRNEPQ